MAVVTVSLSCEVWKVHLRGLSASLLFFFQLPPLLIPDFKITTRKRARMNEHRQQVALVSLCVFVFQLYKHAAASPAAAIGQDRSAGTGSWRQGRLGGTRPACSQ